jgi:putative DNA primase/helicase
MKRRMHLVPFTITVPPERRDGQLTIKLLKERDGILAWMLEGCLGWQKSKLQRPEKVIAATDEYFEAEDAIGRWLEERCLRAPSAKSLTTELFSDWKRWADDSGEFTGSQRRFSDLLITRGLEKWRNHSGIRGFQGIGLREPPCDRHVPYADN